MKEIFKTINGYQNYQVSNLGRIKSLERKVRQPVSGYRTIKQKLLKQNEDSKGYLMVNLSGNQTYKTKYVHQLVAIAFLNHKPNGHQLVVNHKDFNNQNNKSSNLEIVTQRENANKKHIKSTSKYTGVYWYKRDKTWRSVISINGKNKYLGYFDNELEASEAYQELLKQIIQL